MDTVQHAWREMLSQLDARGYRLTPQRQLILEALFACSSQMPAASDVQ